MTIHIQPFLDCALDEIRSRAPDYLERFPLGFPTPDACYDKHVSAYPLTGCSPESFSRTFDAGIDYLRRSGVRVGGEPGDPVAEMLADTLADAACVEPGEPSVSLPSAAFRARFDALYEQGRTTSGRRYFVRRGGARPLLLIPALAVPLHVWSRLLLDESHDFRIIVVETETSDIFGGGMRAKGSIAGDAADIFDAVACSGLGEIDVLAWCNGAKIALELLSQASFRTLGVVSPSFSSRDDPASDQSSYEHGLRQVFNAISHKPSMARLLARGLEQLTQPVDWNGPGRSGDDRARLLFNLPAHDHAAALKSPFADVESLRRYSERGCEDLEYPVLRRLADVQVPCLLVTGDADRVVNNRFAAGLMARQCRSFTHATIRGAGHYTFDLQYPYFRSVVAEFSEDLRTRARVRVDVDRVGSLVAAE